MREHYESVVRGRKGENVDKRTDNPDMEAITRCVICGKTLAFLRKHVDTCGERCYKTLLERQRDAAFGVDRGIKRGKHVQGND